MLKSDGNGGYNISKASTITIGFALAIIGMVAGMAIAWGTQSQMISDHICNPTAHWTQKDLNDAYMPRGEMQTHLQHIDATLTRMEAKLDRLQ